MAMLTGSRQWVVVLAGGDGRRLAAATMDSDGNHVPKQFCRFGSDASVLSHTLERAGRLAGPDRIVAVVQEAHRRWWQDELRALPRSNVISQRANRGTAVALLQALDTIVARDRDAQLLVLPSDQEVADEHAWHTTLRRVVDAALAAPEHVVLVGVEPQPDPDYGWILPGELVGQHARTVLGFAEKPGAAAAAELAVRGGLCSAFVFAASAMALLDLFSRHPALPIARREACWIPASRLPLQRSSPIPTSATTCSSERPTVRAWSRESRAAGPTSARPPGSPAGSGNVRARCRR
jgi:mannose-1-phosphate guanylyltransferase